MSDLHFYCTFEEINKLIDNHSTIEYIVLEPRTYTPFPVKKVTIFFFPGRNHPWSAFSRTTSG